MRFKKFYLFTSKCLTISTELNNRNEIENILKQNNIDWDAIVKISTENYVFPTIYCNLRKARLLKYIPDDVVKYMKYITDLNIKRNKKIIQQSKDINLLLRQNDINPIFIKGTSHLFQGLYNDIGERMIGDIDFLVDKKEIDKSFKILKNNNYFCKENSKEFFPSFRHMPRMIEKDSQIAIELHKHLILEEFRTEFNYDIIKKNINEFEGLNLLSTENQLVMAAVSSHVNDYGLQRGNISLRNAYDVYLLSKKIDINKLVSNFNLLGHPLTSFVSACNLIFGEPKSLKINYTKKNKYYIKKLNWILHNPSLKQILFSKKLFIDLKRKFKIIFLSILNIRNRKWLMRRVKRKLKFLIKK